MKVNPMITNNVTRMLDAKKIPYTVFVLPAEKLGAIETARYLGVPLEKVFKTHRGKARKQRKAYPGNRARVS